MNEIDNIVNKYMRGILPNKEKIKKNFKSRNQFKILDDANGDKYDLGVDKSKLYIEKLMMK